MKQNIELIKVKSIFIIIEKEINKIEIYVNNMLNIFFNKLDYFIYKY